MVQKGDESVILRTEKGKEDCMMTQENANLAESPRKCTSQGPKTVSDLSQFIVVGMVVSLYGAYWACKSGNLKL